jgi:predicted nuclease of predicted toxin-antitoxin system
MRFKIDENIPIEVAEILINSGHESTTVFDENLAGTKDEVIASRCIQEKRVLLSMDLGFAYPQSWYLDPISNL